MQTSPVIRFRETFYARWSWWLLLLTFALTFFSPDRGAASNLYRLFVALPALLMLSAPIITGLKEIKSVRWFAVLSLYFLVSIFWSGEVESFDNHFLRILSVWGFVLLLYYISLYRPDMFARIDLVMVGFGLVWLLILIADWDSLWKSSPHFRMRGCNLWCFCSSAAGGLDVSGLVITVVAEDVQKRFSLFAMDDIDNGLCCRFVLHTIQRRFTRFFCRGIRLFYN